MLNTVLVLRNGRDIQQYVGNCGELFYDPERVSAGIRISDGVTPGGNPATECESLPVGSIIVSHKDASIPGFIKLDGTKHSPKQYPQLVDAGFPIIGSLLGSNECNYASDDVGSAIWGMRFRILQRPQINALWMAWADNGQTLIEWNSATIESSGDSFELSAYNVKIGYVDQNIANYGSKAIRWALELVDPTTGSISTIDERALDVHTELKPNTEYEFILPSAFTVNPNTSIRLRILSYATYCCMSQVRFFTGGEMADVLKLPEGRTEVFACSTPSPGVYGMGLSDNYQAFIRI